MQTSHSPSDLARAVQTEVRQRAKTSLSSRVLDELFEVLFAASLKTEEGQPITCHVSYLDPNNPDPDPPKYLRHDRWSFVPFAEEVPLNVPNVVKLAKATDPRSSSFAVFPRDGELYVWGMIDQGNSSYLFVNHDSQSGFARPGLFHASISGLAHLTAFNEFTKIAELRVNALISEAHDIFWHGPVHKLLVPAMDVMIDRVRSALPDHYYDDDDGWLSFISYEYVRSLCRLPLRAVGYRHGGAVLITPEISFEHLRIKHKITYARLADAIQARAIHKVQQHYAQAEISGKYLDTESDNIPALLYLDESVAADEADDCDSEIDGALWFISLLTRVDGLVVMTPDLTVHGFGTEILTPNEPELIALAGDTRATVKRLRPLSYEHYGTRHRSMMRYCFSVPGSLGLVISQDGDVRAMTRVRSRLVIWDNLRLQIHDYARLRKDLQDTKGSGA
jgi:hypothetical protein